MSFVYVSNGIPVWTTPCITSHFALIQNVASHGESPLDMLSPQSGKTWLSKPNVSQ